MRYRRAALRRSIAGRRRRAGASHRSRARPQIQRAHDLSAKELLSQDQRLADRGGRSMQALRTRRRNRQQRRNARPLQRPRSNGCDGAPAGNLHLQRPQSCRGAWLRHACRLRAQGSGESRVARSARSLRHRCRLKEPLVRSARASGLRSHPRASRLGDLRLERRARSCSCAVRLARTQDRRARYDHPQPRLRGDEPVRSDLRRPAGKSRDVLRSRGERESAVSLVSLATLAPAPDVARLIGLLERLVEIDTQNPPGREVEAAALLASELQAVGFVTEVRPVGDGRANVVGRIDNGEGPCFAFNSHIDTVPFRLTERDGKLFGRGACDAKGPIVAMAEAGRLLALQRDHWRGTLIMMFVADEEINGGGSRALAKQGPTPDLIVIGEPTNNAVFAAHKGCLRPLVRAKGKAAHSGRPELGVNAILAASQLMSLFDARDRELRRLHHPLVGHASLSVTRIAGGIGDNVIPEICEMVLDRRLLPGETLDDAMDDLHGLLDRAKREHGVDTEIAAIRTKAGSAETALDEPLVRDAVAISRAHGVTFPQPGGLTGGCDLVHFHDVGAVGIVLGPGSLDVAHQPDVYVRKDGLACAALIYRDIAVAMMQP